MEMVQRGKRSLHIKDQAEFIPEQFLSDTIENFIKGDIYFEKTYSALRKYLLILLQFLLSLSQYKCNEK
jgi:hypothetical protein